MLQWPTSARKLRPEMAALALDVKVILTPAYIFHL
jgi:hypothetical protein